MSAHNQAFLHTRSFEEEQTKKANDRIKELKEQGHSCLSCKYFPISWGNDREVFCTHPHKRKDTNKKPIRHYNICHLHKLPTLDYKDYSPNKVLAKEVEKRIKANELMHRKYRSKKK